MAKVGELAGRIKMFFVKIGHHGLLLDFADDSLKIYWDGERRVMISSNTIDFVLGMFFLVALFLLILRVAK